jgi:zinc transport system permease protein
MIEEAVLRSMLAGFGVAAVTGTLGCFVVWRRMAYFGDSLAHSALLGIALGVLAHHLFLGDITSFIAAETIQPPHHQHHHAEGDVPTLHSPWTSGGVLLVCVTFAVLLAWLQHRRILATDTLLGIMAHAALSIGVVVMAWMGMPELDIHAYMFGDILSVTWADMWRIYGGGAIVLALLGSHWSGLLLVTVHEDLAKAERLPIFRLHLILMLAMALVVVIAIHLVGMLLITSLLIIPAATARFLARSPEAMVVIASLVGAFSMLLGVILSVKTHVPSGAAVVVVAMLFFIVTAVLSSSLRTAR